jgi:hypothetical protein
MEMFVEILCLINLFTPHQLDLKQVARLFTVHTVT